MGIIYHQESQVVGGNPSFSILRGGDVSDEHSLAGRHSHFLVIHKGMHTYVPLLLGRAIDIGFAIGEHPIVVATVDKAESTIILVGMVLGEVRVGPEHLLVDAIDAAERSIVEGEHGCAMLFGNGRYEFSLLDTHILIREKVALQGLSFYEATTLVVEHKPKVLVGVDEHLIYSTIHADGAEPLLRMAVESLLVILVDTIAYTGMNPEVSLPVLLDVIHGVVGNGLLIQVLIKEVPEAKTVKAVETRLGGKPHISPIVLEDAVDLPIAESVTIGEGIELQVQLLREVTISRHCQQHENEIDI